VSPRLLCIVCGVRPELVWVGGVGPLCHECHYIHRRVERVRILNEFMLEHVPAEHHDRFREVMFAASPETDEA